MINRQIYSSLDSELLSNIIPVLLQDTSEAVQHNTLLSIIKLLQNSQYDMLERIIKHNEKLLKIKSNDINKNY